MGFNKLLYIVTFILLPVQGFAQDRSWDFQAYPPLEISITHASGNIQIDEAGTVGGTITYDIFFKNSFTDTLFFDAVELDIRSVRINDIDADYLVSDDQLNILVPEPFTAGSEGTVEIRYSGKAGFGFHQSDSQILWSSALPRTTSHWLPVIDSPRISFTSDFEFHYPSGRQLIFNGRHESGEIVSVDQESAIYRSERPVSPDGLRLVIGSFDYHGNSASDMPGSSAFSGSQAPQIHLYSEKPDQLSLLESAAEYFINIQNYLGQPFPFDDLHIVYLDDSQWEVKQTGSGILYLFEDAGDLDHQLKTGMISQWTGESLRAVSWQRSEPLMMMQAFLLNEVFDASLSLRNVLEPYDLYSAHTRSEWQHFFREEASDKLKEAFQSAVLSYRYDGSEVTDWNLFAEKLYQESGTPWFSGFQKPELEMPATETPEEESPEISVSVPATRYHARIQWEEGGERAEIFFNAEDEIINELVTVRVEEITFSGRNVHEVTFTGASDGVVIAVNRVLENIKLTVMGRDDVELLTDKPLMFWIYQLQNDNEPERRREAARALASVEDNPDIQLALNDLLRTESDAAVYAELLRSLGTLTEGASGTDELFMQQTGQDQPTAVRLAAAEALGNYHGNEMAIRQLRSLIVQANSRELRREAIRSLQNITDSERFIAETEPLLTREQLLPEVPLILNLYAEHGNPEKAVEISNDFLEGEFPLQVRLDFISLIAQYDRSPDNWENRLPVLLNDPHPAIRYHAVQALEYIPQDRRDELIQIVLDQEFDERIRRIAVAAR